MIPCSNCKVNIRQRHLMFSGPGPRVRAQPSHAQAARLCSEWWWIVCNNIWMNNFSQFAQSIRQAQRPRAVLGLHPIPANQRQALWRGSQSEAWISAWPRSQVPGLMAPRCQLWKICNECNYLSGISISGHRLSPAPAFHSPLVPIHVASANKHWRWQLSVTTT